MLVSHVGLLGELALHQRRVISEEAWQKRASKLKVGCRRNSQLVFLGVSGAIGDVGRLQVKKVVQWHRTRGPGVFPAGRESSRHQLHAVKRVLVLTVTLLSGISRALRQPSSMWVRSGETREAGPPGLGDQTASGTSARGRYQQEATKQSQRDMPAVMSTLSEPPEFRVQSRKLETARPHAL